MGEAQDGRAPAPWAPALLGTGRETLLQGRQLWWIVMPSPAGRAHAGTRSKAEDEKVGTCDLPFSPPKFCLIFFVNRVKPVLSWL